jgi:Rod binding domain-containing protein
MQILSTTAPSLLLAPSATESQRLDEQRSFSSVLAQAQSAEIDPNTQAREAAEQFVSVALVQPILQHLRQDNAAAPPFGPGKGEQAFQGLMDAEISQRLTRKSNWALVDQVAARLTAKLQNANGGQSK